MAKHRYEMDLCTGSVPGKIILFAFPLMASSVLQLLFNAADVIVVGKFVGSEALAAVGSNGPVVNLIVNIFLGISIGGSAVVAKHFGAQEYEEVSETTHTAMVLGIICGILVMFVGLFLASPILIWMDTPSDILPLATKYLTIYFLGMPGCLIYNSGAAVLRGVGDTKRPLIFLSIAGIVNVLLNLLLVIRFNMSVVGVAIATAVSQYVSAVLVVICMKKTNGCYQLVRSELRIHKDKMIRILKIGIPAGLQGALFSISNVLIQSGVNSFGKITMAGNAATVNIEGFIFTGVNALAQTGLTFTSQNLGARNMKRTRMTVRWCILFVVILMEMVTVLVYKFGGPLLSIYDNNPDVIVMGMIRIRYVTVFYALDGIMDVMAGLLRGMGASLTPMVVILIGVCGVRVVWILTAFQQFHELSVLYSCYPITWILASTILLICYFVIRRRLDRQLQMDEWYLK